MLLKCIKMSLDYNQIKLFIMFLEIQVLSSLLCKRNCVNYNRSIIEKIGVILFIFGLSTYVSVILSILVESA